MNTNEIVENNEVVEVTEKIAEAGNGKALKVAGVVGLVALAGLVTYKYIVKPITAKRKAKKSQQMEATEGNSDDTEFDNED